MKNMIAVILATIAFSFNVNAQPTLQWVRQFDGYGKNDYISDIKVYNGSVYIAGWVTNSSNEHDFIVMKYDNEGNREWLQLYDGTASDRAKSLDARGGYIYVTGTTKSGSDYDWVTFKLDTSAGTGISSPILWPAGGNTINDSAGIVKAGLLGSNPDTFFVAGNSSATSSNPDLRVIKYHNVVGELANRVYDSGNKDYFVDMAIDNNNNVFVLGKTENSAGSGTYDFLLVKYSSNMTQQWVRTWGTAGVADNPYDITVDNNGNVYIVGEKLNTTEFNNDFVTLKYNSSGTLQWANVVNGSSHYWDSGFSITTDNTYVYVTGNINGGGIVGTIKYDLSGTQQWEREYNNAAQGRLLSIDNSGNVYVGGDARHSTYTDFLLLKYNSSGTEQYAQLYDGNLPNGVDWATAMKPDAYGNIFLAGYTTTSTLNPAPEDWLIVKYNVGGTFPSKAAFGPTPYDQEVAEKFSLSQNYPNPFNPTTTIQFTLKEDDIVTLKVYDILGRELKTLFSNEYFNKGEHRVNFDATGYASGIYFYRIDIGNGKLQSVKKMLLAK